MLTGLCKGRSITFHLCLLSGIVTVDETWVYFYDPETKHQTIEENTLFFQGQKKNVMIKNMSEKLLLQFLGLLRNNHD